MAIYKSRFFWLASSSATAIAGLCWWDRQQAAHQWHAFLREAQQLGDAPHPISLDGQASIPLRKVTLVLAAKDGDELRRHKRIFREFVAPLFTQAGIDYVMVEEKDEEDLLAINKLQERIPSLLGSPQVVQDGLVSLNAQGYRVLLESVSASQLLESVSASQPRLGLINCDVDARLRDRLYWALHRQKLVTLVGDETMRVIRDQVRAMALKDALPGLEDHSGIAYFYQ